MKHLLLVPLVATLLGFLAIPAAAQTGTPSADTFPPNPNLLIQGIPPIPMSLVERVARYTDFRGHRFVDWHPQREEMLVAYRKAGDTLTQVYRLNRPLGDLEQLTADSEPVSQASYDPREGRYIVFERSSGGNEAAQIYRMDLDTRRTTLLTPPEERHDMSDWTPDGTRLLVSSVPLDRTAASGRRDQVSTRLWLVDPLQPETRRTLAELPGPGWYPAGFTPDGRQLSLIRYVAATQSELWLMDAATGERRQVLPAPGHTRRTTYIPGPFTPDGRGIFLSSDHFGEFNELVHLDIATGTLSRMSAHIPWDASGMGLSADKRHLAVQFNIDGRDELRLFDTSTRAELPVPPQPAGNIGTARFHRKLNLLALSVNSAQGPSQLSVLDPAAGRQQDWTRAYAPPGVDMGSFRDQQIVRWKSFDGRMISGLLNLPPARFTGRRPVIIDIHGGPEAQARIGFLGRQNYFVQELGVAVIQPNVRGSDGFGKTFLDLDNGRLREDSVKDIGALLDWIATQPGLDPARVMVMGGSYGGYMSLAVSTHYADRIAGAMDAVGISNFVTFLETTESYRRDLRRAEYGDERDPAMREFLNSISPLTNAHRIKKPLFVVQGKNDPRVPYTEAEQIVARARSNGTPVWYLRAENEGHGFARKENADFYFYALTMFVEQVLQPGRTP